MIVRVSTSGFTASIARADAPNTAADPAARAQTDEVLRALPAPRGFTASDRVRDLIEVLLPTGRCSADEVARTMGVDRRTLHRHLSVEQDTFSSIVDSTRAGLAERYLANDRYRLTKISELLGFSAPSAFTRWFRARFGESPTQWRTRRSVVDRRALGDLRGIVQESPAATMAAVDAQN